MIYITYRGRLGNKMFQYVLARILSEKFNQEIQNDPPDFSFTQEKIKNNKVYNKNILVDDNNFLEILELENIDSQNIIISGYFQNALLPLKYHKEILETININYKENKGIFIHYRLGDFITHKNGQLIPIEQYYIYCLDEILKTSKEKVYISTDSPEHNRIVYLQKKYKAKIIDVKKPRDAIIFGCQFKNKILSLGTFSWWIGFLGSQDNILCPNIKDFSTYCPDIFPFKGWKVINKKDYYLKKK
jgi:hypothetical protein